MIELTEVKSEKDYQTAVGLFKEYNASIGIDLSFQNFSYELENVKSQYSRPEGVLCLVHYKMNSASGCFGVRKLNKTVCELKRMYLKPELRGMGIGELMLEKSFELAKKLGYLKMRLDTLSTMNAAIGLYKKMGFYEIEPYRFNPLEGAKYFEINLDY